METNYAFSVVSRSARPLEGGLVVTISNRSFSVAMFMPVFQVGAFPCSTY